MFYTLIKAVLAPLSGLYFRPRIRGRIPRKGGYIIASNHESFLDHFVFPLAIRRRMTYMAKSELFESAIGKWFFGNLSQIPVHRGRGDSEAFAAALQVLKNGGLLGIYPEGTRSPDGRLCKGHSGVARLALLSGRPVIPIGMIGTFEALPKGKLIPRFKRITIRIGKPMDFSIYAGMEQNREVTRKITDTIMHAIGELTGEEYDPKRGYMDPSVMPGSVGNDRMG